MIRTVTAILFVASFLVAPSSLRAQFHDRDLPPDSVAWWTLTDDLTPEAYRETFRSPQAAQKRYLDDVAAEKAEPLTEDRRQALTFFVSAENTPELIPMWLAFDVFASTHLAYIFDRETLEKKLQDSGISELGAQLILDTATGRQALFDEASESIRPLIEEFWAFQERAEAALGGTLEAYRTFRSAVAQSDAQFLAPLGGETVSKTAELIAAAKIAPGLEAAKQLLPNLKKNLTKNDWDAFRSYLLKEVVSGMGSLGEFEG